MAEIVLSQAGSVIGSHLLPNGLSVFGQNLSGAVLGEAVGRLAGRAIDASLAPVSEGPRIKSLHVMESREGAGLPLVYGRMRVGGQVIWASRFKEYRREQSAGKGGPKYSEYTYSVSFAVALCQGPITRVDRVWANGEFVTLSEVNWRLYSGTDAQLPDPLIEAIEGGGNAPAYRGTAYIVFEDFPLDAYGNRLPQMSFEVVRAGRAEADSLSQHVEGVNVIPGSGEFVYATSIVRERRFPGIERPLNMNNARGAADFCLSLEQLSSDLPKVSHTALTVAWFGSDLRAARCRIRPGVETFDRETVPYAWAVDGMGREAAHLISRTDDRPNYGGTPADQAVIEGIQAMKTAGLAVTLSPFLMMDIPPGNDLPDPYGESEQAAFPWRGRLTVTDDRTASARAAIEAFVGEDGGFGFRHFILHHARLSVQAGGVDAFLIGSEMIGLTRVRDDEGRFPFVEALIEIASDVRAIIGDGVAISYAADWTEYGAYLPSDGSGDVLFPLDPFWASPDVDFVGLDWYPPMSDWRDGDDHLDRMAGFDQIGDEAYLQHNLSGGEAYDWYYASDADRTSQTRRPIADGAYGEDWVFRQKDLASWWGQSHHPRAAGVRDTSATAWVPGSKPVRLIELGVPAVDKGTNAPNLFFDPKSAESRLPHFSIGARDDLLQRRALAVANTFWRGQPMVEQVLNWAWDGRPWPAYPSREDVWSDGPNWQFGHWLNGRTGLISVAELIEDCAARAGTEIDAEGVDGVLEGFVLDSVSSLARALSPLADAFDFSVIETETGLRAEHDGTQPVAELALDAAIEDSLSATRDLLDKQPSAVSLQFISGDLSYAPAVIEARRTGAASELKVGLSYPIVMGEGQARILAEQRLTDILDTERQSLSLAPGVARGLEILDRVTVADADWIVHRIEERGLQRRLGLRPTRARPTLPQSIEPPSDGDAAIVRADPVLQIVDGPPLEHLGGAAVWVAAAADPWIGTYTLKLGSSIETLSEVATLRTSAGLGVLTAPFNAGPLGRWDEGGMIELEMPNASFSSIARDAVLSGQNRILIEHDTGWELIGWQSAELVAIDTWRLSGLLRGLAGSPVRAVAPGASVVLTDDRLVALPLTREAYGQTFLSQVDGGELGSIEFQDRASLPWRVGHLSARRVAGETIVSWTARGPHYSNNWDLSDTPTDAVFQIELYLEEALISQFSQSESELQLSSTTADKIRVAEISADDRVGEWGSIPL
ncbi:MAG: glycoside hydrolase TIM-barrel-like domain-containing protein [Henriciella sp.]|nr:glycoside hydrolase TIM-barrel-like domain-containing protein [Henriciella sp.]